MIIHDITHFDPKSVPNLQKEIESRSAVEKESIRAERRTRNTCPHPQRSLIISLKTVCKLYPGSTDLTVSSTLIRITAQHNINTAD